MKRKEFALLLMVLILAASLRFYRLADNPPSLNWDEVSHGFNAYSILETGQDEWGAKWPTIFRVYGDYKLPVYIYLTAIAEKLFGLSELAVRLPSAVAGVLSVLMVYFLTQELFGNSVHLRGVVASRRATSEVFLGLIASFLLAVSPWHLFLSRVAVEANVALFFIIGGVFFFLRGLKNGWWLLASSLFFGLSLFTYNSARVFVPLLTMALIWIYRKKWRRQGKKYEIKKVVATLVFLVFLIGMMTSFLNPSGQARYQWVSLIDEGAIQKINQARGQSELPGIFPIILHNKGTYLITQFSKNYLAHFSPKFLFFEGGSHYQFNLPETGLLYLISAPFILIGFWYLLRNRNQASKVILSWLFLSPIASSITRDSPHALRAIVMLPIWQILTAVGLAWVFGVIKNMNFRLIFLILYLSLITYHLSLFWRAYFGSYRQEYSWAWQYGYKQMVGFVKENYDQYDQIIITKKYGEPHEFVLFYWPWSPQQYRNDPNLDRYFQTNWYWVDGFDKFRFVNDWEMGEVKSEELSREAGSRSAGGVGSKKSLLVTSPGNYAEGWEKIETINFLDGKPAFEILENNP